MPIKSLFTSSDTSPVVPLPKNGSNTMPPAGEPANMQGLISSAPFPLFRDRKISDKMERKGELNNGN